MFPEPEAMARQQPGEKVLAPHLSQLQPLNCPGIKKQPSLWPQCARYLQFYPTAFPFFLDSSKWLKNTIHNLCFLSSFEKAPVNHHDGTKAKPPSGLWRLTEEGHCCFQEKTHALASAQRESIQQCMSQTDIVTSLFDF